MRDALWPQHFVECADGVRNAGLQAVVGVHKQGSVVGIRLAVGAEGVELGVKHLHPGVRHRAAGVHAVQLVRDRAGSPGAAADVGSARAENRAVSALRAAGAEFQHRPAPGGPLDAIGLSGDEALVVDGQQGERLDQLRLDGRCADHHQRLLGKYRRALGDGIDIAGEAEVTEIGQKFLAEDAAAPQVGDVLLREVQVLDVVDELLQSRRDGEAAAVRHLPEKYVEIHDAILVAGLEIPVAHGQLVEIAKHSHVQLFLCFHPSYLNIGLCAPRKVY